jgi:hypothetical protein
VPLAKRALTADKAKQAVVADAAKKLGPVATKALVQQAVSAAVPRAVEQSAQTPGPASTAAGLVVVKTAPYSLGAKQGSDFSVACDSGAKAIGGGVDEGSGDAITFDTRPTADGSGWRIFLYNLSSSDASAGTVYAICLK